MLRVTLVSASIVRESELPGFESVTDFASESFNLAIASLKAAVLQEPDLADRVQVTLLDFGIGWDRKSLGARETRAVLETEPDVVGLSCYCWSMDTLLDLAAALGESEKHPFVLLGGPSAGPIAHDILAAHACIDAVAIGEGELTFTHLLRALDEHANLSSVPGLVYRDALGAAQTSIESDTAVPLDRLPSPYRAGVLAPGRSMLLETSRGCRFRCKFCSWMGGGSRLRYVPIASIEADLRWALEHGIRDIKFADTAINFHTERVRELTDAIRRVDPSGTLRFTYFLKPELLTEEQADCLRGIPADEIIIGIESLTDAARRAVGKPRFDPVEFERTIGLLEGVGPVTVSLILGLPGDSEDGLRQTLEWMTAFDRAHPGALHVICLFWLALLPGANLHANRDTHAFRVAPRETPYVLESRHFDPDRLLAMARESIEIHYRHPGLRVEYFQKEYLMQDAPAAERHVSIARRNDDPRACTLLVGLVDPDAQQRDGLRPYSLESAWMKAYAEADATIRQSTRIELVHLDARDGASAAQVGEAVALLRGYAPSSLVMSLHSGSRRFAEALLDRLGHELPDATLLACDGAEGEEAVALLSRIPSLHAVFSDEPEIAYRAWLAGGMSGTGVAGMVVRRAKELVAGGPALLVDDLDTIPSPLQWGFVQRVGSTIAMRWSRPPSASRPVVPRVFSPERIYGDMRWAIEQRHDHVLWLDNELPADASPLRGFVDALRRADPERRVHHTYTVSPAALTDEVVDLLAGITTREIRASQAPESDVAGERLARLRDRVGARPAHAPPPGPSPRRSLETLLLPWRVGAVVEHWRLDAIEPVPDTTGGARISFAWRDGPRATVTLAPDAADQQGRARAWRATVSVPDGSARPPDAAIRRLTEMITTILDSARRRAAKARRPNT